MNKTIISVDLDWASEGAIEDTLDFLQSKEISPTVFITHRSRCIEGSMATLEVGLHPYFDPDSSHGSTISSVVDHVMDLPHNFSGFRCHRFKVCNQSKFAMVKKGMYISSNVCTDLEVLPPFRDRFGLLEVPIFFEDGGYLWRGHSLEMNPFLKGALKSDGVKVIIIHPMHFIVNTPVFDYMVKIKRSMSRKKWNTLKKKDLEKMRWKGRGIRNLLEDLLEMIPRESISSMRNLLELQHQSQN